MSKPTRRDFFRTGGALGALSAIWPLSRVLAQNDAPGGYRGLVCVFLHGGNDSNNMVIPLGASYNDYYLEARPHIAISDAELSALNIANQNDASVNPTREPWGFHPALRPAGRTGLHDLFNQGDLAVVGNVGTLVEPITAAQLRNGGGAVPIQLASHRDQQMQWHAAISDRPFATGWGGRLTDDPSVLVENLANRVSLSGETQFLTGANTAQGILQVGSQIGTPLDAESNTYLLPLLNDLYQDPSTATPNLFEETFRSRSNQVRSQGEQLRALFDNFSDPAGWPSFPSDTFGQQLRRAAIVISAQAELGQDRQVFFAQLNGFDTHQRQLPAHANLMTQLNDGLVAFQQALEALEKKDDVTTFTASDFNRTWTNNRDDESAGTDHGWGGHALVLGGAVNGGQFYGRMPILDLEGPDHSPAGGRASWVPAVSVDEYSATIAKWFGLDDTQVHQILPNLHRFNNQDLGFLA